MVRTLAATMLLAGAGLLAAQTRASDLDTILAKAAQGKKAPGAGLMTIRDFRVADQAVLGVRRLGDPSPITTGDVWNIGSDGKAMTAVMVARLVDRGQLSWNATLADLWPDAAAQMRPDYRSVTLLQLLTHTSGLPENITDEKALDALFYADSPLSATERRKAYVLRALQDPPSGRPGRFKYSNTGFLVAAAIAERASGSSYESLMRTEVFEPLKMTSASFGLPPAGQPIGHIHGRIAVPRDENPEFFAPAGNIYLSLEDWSRFCIDQMRGANGRGALKGLPGPVLYHEGSDGAWFAIVALFPKSGAGVLAVTNAGKDMGGEALDMDAGVTAARLATAVDAPAK